MQAVFREGKLQRLEDGWFIVHQQYPDHLLPPESSGCVKQVLIQLFFSSR
jgi:hypothetical protein